MDHGSDVRWGIVGPGRIAAKVVEDFAHTPGAVAVAAASRSVERARAFCDEHGLETAYGSYGDIIAAPDIDALYIATPHPQHHAIALAGLRAGKALLVEKAFTATHAGAVEVVAEARRLGVFAMEAMWTRFQPAVVRLRELVAEGAIGEVVAVHADLGIRRAFDRADRLWAPELGGGALLDLGVYPVSFAQMVLGTPSTVHAVGALAPTGVEQSASLLMGYEDGRAATAVTSLRSPMPGRAVVHGTGGSIELPPRFHHPTSLVLHRDGADPEPIELPPLGRGYAEELVEVTECLLAGRTESEVMPLEDTLAVMSVLEQAGRQLGVEQAEDASVEV
jgi:predicted dehydrogenase